MRKDGANHFVAAAEIMNRGMVVLLLTDLKTTFIMNSDLEIADFLQLGGVRNENAEAFVLLKLNPLVNSLLRHVDEPVELKIQHQTYSVFRKIQGGLSIKSPEEMHVLQLLRDRNCSRVSVETESGEIVRLEAESNHRIGNAAEVLALIDEHRYQTVTVTTQDGKIVKARRTKSIRPNRTGRDGMTPSDRVRNRKAGQS
jgi:small nuclear ribonucleoprotein (snRNP)-like protein